MCPTAACAQWTCPPSTIADRNSRTWAFEVPEGCKAVFRTNNPVVIYLNRLMPLEGGLYQWAKLGFNQTVGFLLAWNLWLYVIVFTSEIGLQCATYLSYAIGPKAAWMTSSSWFVALSSAVVLSLMVVSVGSGAVMIVVSLLGAFAAILGVRIASEFVLVMFRMNEHLGALRSRAEM